MILLHSIQEISTADLIAELMARSIDMTSAIQQMKAERLNAVVQPLSPQTSDKIIRYPVQAERLYGTG